MKENKIKQINIMEVCGTHTMSIAKAGIKQLLPGNIRLISGPGCPVCVTPQEEIDAILKFSENKNTIITTYGDMLRVPGSRKGDNLYKRKALGANVEMVYSPVDAVNIAKENPGKEVVFLGVGFETTAPGTAAAIKSAADLNLKNFSVLSMLKTVEPAIRTLAADPDFNIQGFLCPGHVAVILGEKGFRFITDELKIPAVIAGFEPGEIIKGITMLLRQIEAVEPHLENAYKTVVAPNGNELAIQIIETYLEPADALWRGLGFIEKSGLKIREEYAQFDAGVRYGIDVVDDVLKRCMMNNENGKSTDTGDYRTNRNLVYISETTENKLNDDFTVILDGRRFKEKIFPKESEGIAEKDRIETLKKVYREKNQTSVCRCGEIICGKLLPKDCPMFGTACTPEDPEGPCMVSSEGACAAAYKYQ